MKNLNLIFSISVLSFLLLTPEARGQKKLSGKNNIKNQLGDKILQRIATAEQKSIEETLAAFYTSKKIATKDQFTLRSRKKDRYDVEHHRLQQKYNGIPVEGAELFLHSKNGLCYSINGRIIDSISANVQAKISPQQALSLALAELPAKQYSWQVPNISGNNKLPVAELILASKDLSFEKNSYQLAYKIEISSLQPLQKQIIYIDADNGQILRKEDRIYNCTHPQAADPISVERDYVCPGTGEGHHLTDAVDFPVFFEALAFTMKDTMRNIEAMNGHYSESFLRQPIVSIEPNLWPPMAVDAYWSTLKIWDYFTDTHGWSSYDGDSSLIIPLVNYGGVDYANAHWFTPYLLFGTSQEAVPFTTTEIVGHEYFHAIIEHKAGLSYNGETGALMEGLCDIFGMYLESVVHDKDMDYIYGNSVLTQTRPFGNPQSTGLPDTYKGLYWENFNNSSAFHTNGLVLSHWFYTLVDSYEVEAATAIKVLFSSLEYLPTHADFVDMCFATIAAVPSVGSPSPSALEDKLLQAWLDVGIGDALLLVDGIQLTKPTMDTVLLRGDLFLLEWLGAGIDSFNVELTLDNGKKWETLAMVDTTVFEWIIPDVDTRTAKIRVIDTERFWIRDTGPLFHIKPCFPEIKWLDSLFMELGDTIIANNGDTLVFTDTSSIVYTELDTIFYGIDMVLSNLSVGDFIQYDDFSELTSGKLYFYHENALVAVLTEAESNFPLLDSGFYHLIVNESPNNCNQIDRFIAIDVEGSPIPCSLSPCLYPGDSNNDGIVDMKDMLPITYFYGERGEAREEQLSVFVGQMPPNDWEGLFLKDINAKFADGNGDGLIDRRDVQVVWNNLGKTAETVAQKNIEKDYKESPIGMVIAPRRANNNFELEVELENDTETPILGIGFAGAVKFTTEISLNDIREITSEIDNGNVIFSGFYNENESKLEFFMGLTDGVGFDLADFTEAVITMNQVIGTNPPGKMVVSEGNSSMSFLSTRGEEFPIVLKNSTCRFDSISGQYTRLYCLISSPADCKRQGSVGVQFDPGVAANYSIEWSNGSTDANINKLTPDTYSVTLTSSDTTIYPTLMDSISINGYPKLAVETCIEPYGSGNQMLVNTSISGGEPPFLLEWDNGGVGEQLVLEKGLYELAIIDNNGCAQKVQMEVGNRGRDSIFLRDDFLFALAGESLSGNVADNDHLLLEDFQINWLESDGLILTSTAGDFVFEQAQGIHKYTYQVCTPFYCDEATLTIQVIENNTPIPIEDHYQVLLNETCSGNVLGNDLRNENDTITLQTPPSTGVFVLEPNGDFTYTFCPNFVGKENFSYSINDGADTVDVLMEVYTESINGLCPCGDRRIIPKDSVIYHSHSDEGYLLLIDSEGSLIKWDSVSIVIYGDELVPGDYKLQELHMVPEIFTEGYLGDISDFNEILEQHGDCCFEEICIDLIVEGCRYAPISQDYFFRLAQGDSLSFQPLEGSEVSIFLQSGIANVEAQGEEIFYNPPAGFTGLDEFIYEIQVEEDEGLKCSKGRVQVFVE